MTNVCLLIAIVVISSLVKHFPINKSMPSINIGYRI